MFQFIYNIFDHFSSKREECPVCYIKFENNVTETPCGHRVCNSCFFKFEKPTCPICRAVFWNVDPSQPEIIVQRRYQPSRYSTLQRKQRRSAALVKAYTRYIKRFSSELHVEKEKQSNLENELKRHRYALGNRKRTKEGFYSYMGIFYTDTGDEVSAENALKNK
jgi:hypothetical protein